MSTLTIGLDCGLTVTKAVVFSEDGRPLASASTRLPQSSPRARWVERDVEEMWEASAQALRSALEQAGVEGSDVAGVGVTAHGDGLYLVDESGAPTRPGIISLDSRAHNVVERWDAEGRTERSLELAGQPFFPAAPAPILAWLLEHEPGSVERARWILPTPSGSTSCSRTQRKRARSAWRCARWSARGSTPRSRPRSPPPCASRRRCGLTTASGSASTPPMATTAA